MPHKCVKCNTVYTDEDEAVMNGCSCGAHVFLYLRSNAGRYELDLEALFAGMPKEEGKYDIDLEAAFKNI